MTRQTIILVRHAESEHHIRRLSGGWTDTPITELGHQQAERVAQRLKDELACPVRVISSDLRRATDTAQHIADAFAVELETDKRLREHNNGEAVNLTVEEMLARFPQIPHPHPADHRPFPGGETAREFALRVGAFLDELDLSGRLPIVVTHGGTIRPFIGHWIGLSPDDTASIGFEAHVTGVTVLRVSGLGYRGIERLNDVSHIQGMPGYVSLATLR